MTRPTVAHRVIMGHHLPLDEGMETFHNYDPARFADQSDAVPLAMPSWSIASLGLAAVVGALMWVAIGWGVCSFLADAHATGMATAAQAGERASW